MYGPVPRAELDDWVTQGRITADCQLLLDGADQWQWATDIYPDLAEEEVEPEPPPPTPAAPMATTASSKATETAKPSGGAKASDGAATSSATTSTGHVKSSWRDEPPRPKTSRGSAAQEFDEEAEDESQDADADDEDATSDRRWVTAFLLAFFLGWLGIHRFYLGRVLTGVAMLFTGGGCLIWQIVDVVSIALERLPDHLGRPLKK